MMCAEKYTEEKDMDQLTLEKAKEINATSVHEEHLLLHAANVSAAMEAMAKHFGEDPEHWAAVGCCTIMTTRHGRKSIWRIRKNRSGSWASRRRISAPF